MASSQSSSQPAVSIGNGVSTITCPTCDKTVTQPPGTKRTICPKCGNFYDANAAQQLRIDHNRRAHNVDTYKSSSRQKQSIKAELPVVHNKNEKEKQGSRLQSIANFFQNLGRQKSPNSKEGTSKNSTPELPPISKGSRLTMDHPQSRSNSRRSDCSDRSKAEGQESSKTVYPDRKSTPEDLKNKVAQAQSDGSWQPVQEFYTTTFDSFLELNALFKRDPNKEFKTTEDSGLKQDYVYTVYDVLMESPQDIQKGVLKAVINSLLKDKRPHTKDDLRAYLILIQNPQFSDSSTYVIFAHLLRQMAALSDHDHHYLVHWFKKIPSKRFKSLVQQLHAFISCRLFPPKPQDLPPMSKCSWWIPSATKVLALLNAANNMVTPPIIGHMDFYNSTLDLLDLMAEYYTWQNPSTHPGFSFCQYPFILSIAAKRTILQRDSEQQMIVMARRSLVAKVQQRQMPNIGMLFLNLNVRRSHLVADSLNEISQKQHDLKKKLKVTFKGEPGLDMGGLTKEWFLLLIKQIFQPEYGMFVFDKKAGTFWFSTAASSNRQEFHLIGVLMGLAVYNSIVLDIKFPPACYQKLLNPAVVPYNNPQAAIGISKFTIKDLALVFPDLTQGLKELLVYEGNVEDDLCMTFQVSITEHGTVRTHQLKPNGDEIPVTKQNRKEYVDLYVDWLLNKSVYEQFKAFYHGFHSVCASNALIMLRPEEVEMLVCGCPTLDMNELKKVTVYDGYTQDHPAVKCFWELVLSMPVDLQKKFMLFCTGSDRVPIGGTSEMQFKITRVENTSMLPMSHTCFNQLVLPPYRNRKIMKQKLLIAIQNAEGFGIE